VVSWSTCKIGILKPFAVINGTLGAVTVGRAVILESDGINLTNPVKKESTPAQDIEMQFYIVGRSQKDLYYNILLRNCVQFAYVCYFDCGFNPPSKGVDLKLTDAEKTEAIIAVLRRNPTWRYGDAWDYLRGLKQIPD
jgi:hypothetical protein